MNKLATMTNTAPSTPTPTNTNHQMLPPTPAPPLPVVHYGSFKDTNPFDGLRIIDVQLMLPELPNLPDKCDDDFCGSSSLVKTNIKFKSLSADPVCVSATINPGNMLTRRAALDPRDVEFISLLGFGGDTQQY